MFLGVERDRICELPIEDFAENIGGRKSSGLKSATGPLSGGRTSSVSRDSNILSLPVLSNSLTGASIGKSFSSQYPHSIFVKIAAVFPRLATATHGQPSSVSAGPPPKI